MYGNSQNNSITRRSANSLNSTVDYNALNQNLLPEHRSTNGNGNNSNAIVTGSSVYRNSPKAGPQSAISTSSSSLTSISTPRVVDSHEKFRRSNTLAESGVLGSHTNTPNGKIAWPGERQTGWLPKQPMNLNQPWCSNGNWSPTGNGEYGPWSTGVPLTTSTSVGGISTSSQNWQQQQQPLPPLPSLPSQPQQTGYRMTTDRGMLYSSQPQMQRIVSISDV